MFAGNVKDLEGTIVEVIILRRPFYNSHDLHTDNDVAYIGRLESADAHAITLKPGVHVGQFHQADRSRADSENYAEHLKEALAKSLTAIVGREHIASIHQSIYTAEELSVKK